MAEEIVRVEINEETREAIREALQDMKETVDIHVFIDDDCMTCKEVLKLVKVLKEEAPNSLIRVHLHHRKIDEEAFKKHGVERVPTLSLLDGTIKYVGTPAGEEIRGLIETIIRISQKDSGLDNSTIAKIKDIKENTHVEVIVTPQCPYCPYASLLVNMFAFEAWRIGNKTFVAETIEAYENPDIADRYKIANVPAIAVNGILVFVGVPYEEDLIERIYDVVKRGKRVNIEVTEGSPI
ncbi:MAG TPA: glutaredoxin [Pyrodictiaceae archaeon]|nr:glutaredoxin [Pyrodictiaceae archaeon]HIQ10440.1 glutaredoxin [Pyrodictium sp.]HIQ56011.1 glutaredoxin [Pyrodictium sp.]